MSGIEEAKKKAAHMAVNEFVTSNMVSHWAPGSFSSCYLIHPHVAVEAWDWQWQHGGLRY